jgi:DNA (cytosine-5)-methyltransferase 1
MRLLDLFCGEGGAGMGYIRAGFDVTGVDIKPQPRYPFAFVQAGALEYMRQHGHEFDVIHASPPCQVYSVTRPLSRGDHPDLVAATREALLAVGKPFVIENVPGAPLINPLVLCGTMFGLQVIRHRLFEVWPEPVWFSPTTCRHEGRSTGGSKNGAPVRRLGKEYQYLSVAGHDFIKADAERAMGIDWMTRNGLSQAIPPAYTEWLGRQLMRYG